ncbi:MAG TPA: SLBB domain-containing protein [Pirellulales bacterium]|nr:SLBB domain-containing protein [Pirellulales bacterium]
MAAQIKFLRACLSLFTVAALGCSTSGGGLTLFPTGDYLMASTKSVRRTVPWYSPLPRELQKTVLDTYVIQPGDGLVIEPGSLDTPLRFTTEQTVLADGTIDLGPYGRPIVAGKAVEQIEVEVQGLINANEKQPITINVRLVNPQSAVYYVLGEVNAPGSFPLIGRETVLDAIVAAGGLNDRASPCNIILARPTYPDGCRLVLTVCYRHIVQLGDTSTNFQIMPGDRVYVATRSLTEQLLPCARRGCKLCRGIQCPCADPSAGPYLPTIIPGRAVYDQPLPADENEPMPLPEPAAEESAKLGARS